MFKKLSTDFLGIRFKNPITTASGTFGSGMEYDEIIDITRLGAITTKGVAIEPWEGNPTPRVAEVSSGMLNAIGLQNPGLDTFIERDLTFLREKNIPVIVNVCGHSEDEYVRAVERPIITSTKIINIKAVRRRCKKRYIAS